MKQDINNYRPIRVMQITFGLEYGGLEQVIFNLCKFMDKNYFKFYICCTDRKGHLVNQMKKFGCEIEFCSFKNGVKKYFRFYEIAQILKKYRIDIVHTHNTPTFLDGVVAAKLARVPIVINTDHCRLYPDKKRYMLAERIASLLTDRIVAVSKHTKNDLVFWEHIRPEKISVIYNGIPQLKRSTSKDLRDLKISLGINDSEMIVGSVGRLEYQKGYDLLIKAAASVTKTLPNVKFIIVGDGSKRFELKQLIERFNLQEKVILTGWKTNGTDFIKIFDIFVMTSNFEGMPIVLLEAMGAKKPIISTDVGGVPEMIKNDENGTIIPFRNANQFAQEISRLLSNKTLLIKYGEQSHNRFLNEFSVVSMIDKYKTLYLECFQKHYPQMLKYNSACLC